MAQSTNPTLTGRFIYNGHLFMNPSPMSFAAMQDKFGDKEITQLQVGHSYEEAIGGSSEAMNEFLDFTVDKIPDLGLSLVWFANWSSSVSEIEAEILTVLASKCTDLQTLSL